MPHGPYPRVADHVDEIEAAQINTIYDALEDTPTVGEMMAAAGLIYPSLLLSPDGSFDRNGPVSPTVGSNVTVVAGQYGQAWQKTASGDGVSLASMSYPTTGTILIRCMYFDAPGADAAHQYVLAWASSGIVIGNMSWEEYRMFSEWLGDTRLPPPARPFYAVSALSWDGAVVRRVLNGSVVVAPQPSPSPATSHTLTVANASINTTYVESVLIYPAALPDSEVARISNMPAAWTMANAVADTTIPNDFDPTHKTASGTTTLRTAPGAATQEITTLSANTLIQDTGHRLTVSSVAYGRVITQAAGPGWVPASQIIAL